MDINTIVQGSEEIRELAQRDPESAGVRALQEIEAAEQSTDPIKRAWAGVCRTYLMLVAVGTSDGGAEVLNRWATAEDTGGAVESYLMAEST